MGGFGTDPTVVYVTSYAVDVTGAADSYAALVLAAAAAGTIKTLVFPPGTYKISTSWAPTCAIRMSPGSKLSPDTGRTVTISGSFDAGLYQVFTGAGSVVFQDGVSNSVEVLPEWYGALGNAHTVVAATVTSGCRTITGSGFTSDMVGRYCVIYGASDLGKVTSGTVAGFTNATTITLSTDATFSGAATCVVSSDDQPGIRAAIVGSRGNHYVALQPNKLYGLATALVMLPGTGRGLKLKGNYATLFAVAPMTHMFTSESGVASSVATASNDIRQLSVNGTNLAQDGVYGANATDDRWAGGMSGRMEDIFIYNCQRYGFYQHAAQVATYVNVQSMFTGNTGITLIACNGTALYMCRASVIMGDAGAALSGSTVTGTNPYPAFYVDAYTNPGVGNSYGGGDVFLYNCLSEIAAGPAIEVHDANGSAGVGGSGSVVAIYGGHFEGVGILGDHGIVVDRKGTIVDGLSISGPATPGIHPVRITNNGGGSVVRGVVASNYNDLSVLLDTGASNCILHPIFNTTGTGSLVDSDPTDGWEAKIQHRYATGDIHAQGKLFLGTSTPAPTHSIQVESGSALLDKGHILQTQGQLANAYGGVGPGLNGLVRAEDFSSASWTKGSDVTVTANAAVGPFGSGALADQISDDGKAVAANVFVRQAVTAATMGGLTIIGSKFIFSLWARAISGTETIRLALVNQAGGREANGNTFADWTVGTTWKRIYVQWTSTSTGAADAIRCIFSSPATADFDIYAWGAQLEYFSANYSSEQAHPGAYAKSIATARTLASDGSVFNSPPVLPGGSGTLTAGTTTTVTDPRVTATSKIFVVWTNAAAGALGAPAITTRTAGASFVITHAAAAGGGAETFEYVIAEGWAA